MGFRFRRSIKIFPGVRINLSKKGVSSISIGRRGAAVNIRANGETRAPRGLFSCREMGAEKEAQPMPRFPFRGASLLLPARPVRDARRQPPGQMRRERVPQALPPFLFHTTSQ